MGYLFILLFSLLNLGEGIAIKEYGKRHGKGGMLVNALISLFAMTFFIATDKGGFCFNEKMIPLGIINSVLYASGFYLSFVAYKLGSFGLTKLVSSFSLLFPIFYGLLFLDEEATVLTFVGIFGILCAIALINFKKGTQNENHNFSFKWLLCILTSAVANGFISIITRYQQIEFNNEASNEFMIISLGGAFVILTAMSFVLDRNNFKYILRHGSPYGMVAGAFNGAKNFITLLIYLYLPISLSSPIKTGVNTILAFSVSILLYKENFTKIQFVGVALGAISVILLNI